MKRLTAALVLGAFAIATSACSSGSSSGSSPYETYYNTDFTQTTDGKRQVSQFSLSCGTGACSPSIALLINATSSYSMAACSSFIAGEYQGKTVMATNRHCIADIYSDSSCQSRVAFKFFDAENEIAGCERIITKSNAPTEDDKSNLDYAFILLDKKVEAAPLPIFNQGVRDEQALHIHKVDTNFDYRHATQNQVDCVAGMNSGLNSKYVSETSRSIGLFQCRIEHGNSGSPVFNSNGQVVAIVQAGAAKATDIELHSLLDANLRELSSSVDITKFAIATNMSCVNVPEINLIKPAANKCVAEGKAETEQLSSNALKGVEPQLNSEIKSMVEANPTVIPKFVTQKGRDKRSMLEIRTQPFCFMPPSDENGNWIEKYKTLFGYENSAHVILKYSNWELIIGYDHFARPKAQSVRSSNLINLEFSPNDLMSNGRTEATVVESRPMNSFFNFPKKVTMKFCTEQDLKDLSKN